MPEVIEIEGNIVRRINREVLAQTTLEQLSPHLQVRASSIYPILPRNLIATGFDPDQKRGVVVIERPASRSFINIHFDRGMHGTTAAEDFARANDNPQRTVRFNIGLPHLYFVYAYRLETRPQDVAVTMADFTIDRTNLYMTRDPVTHMTDTLWPAKFPNVENARICWGGTIYDNDSLAVRINHMVAEFESTVFNNHYGIPLPQGVASLLNWETSSGDDPFWYRTWEQWATVPPRHTIGELIQKFLTDTGGTPISTAMRGNTLIEPPPTQFTTGRLLEWHARLPASLKAMFMRMAVQSINEGDPQEDAYEVWRAEREEAERLARETAATLDEAADDEDEEMDDDA